jgi:peptidoglycan hydrolase-like protein with peptidoglycan-binding domain
MTNFRAQVAERLRARKVGPVAPTGDPVLKVGDSGQKVKDIQNALVKHKFLTASQVDSQFGPTTEKAVKAFQTAKKLVADGVVGQKTWDALRKPYEAPAVTPAPAPAPTPTTGGKRMLVQFKGDPHVWEVVGSELVHVTAAAWKARGLTSRDVVVVDPTHALNALPKVK